MVYPEVETIFARKPDGQLYRHDFKSSAPLIGEPDGSLRIPGRPKKWAVIDGEAWMVNPPARRTRRRKAGRRRKNRARKNHALAIYALNRPDEDTVARKRNRKGQYMKKKSHGRRYGRRRHARVAAYRASRRTSSRRGYPRRRRRGYRRNPPIGGFMGRLIPPIEPVLMAVAGATATRFVANQIEGFFPNLVVSTGPGGVPQENKMARTAVKIAAAIAAGLVGGMVLGRAKGSQLAAGGLVVVTDELVRTELLPKVGLSEYVEPYEYVEAYVPSTGMNAGDGQPGQVPMLTDGYGFDDDLSAFMDDDFTPGRLSPDARLN